MQLWSGKFWSLQVFSLIAIVKIFPSSLSSISVTAFTNSKRNFQRGQMYRPSLGISKMTGQLLNTKRKASSISSSTVTSVASSIQSEDPILSKLCKSIISTKSYKVSFAIAGGGSKAVSSLVSTPGASSVLLNGEILYDRNSFCQYISEHLKHSQHMLETIDNYQSKDGKFGFASSGAATLLSQAALHHSFQQAQQIDLMKNKVLAVGCTSTLVSHGREDRKSRAYISVASGDGKVTKWDILLSNQNKGKNGEEARRDRSQEETLLAELILSSIQQYSCNEQQFTIDTQELLDREGDEIQVSTSTPAFHSLNNTEFIENAARMVIDKDDKTDAIILGMDKESRELSPLAHTVLPSDPIIFPGSFNPPHIGHVTLATAAVKTMTRKKQQELSKYFMSEDSDILESMWNTSDFQSFKHITNDTVKEGPFTVLFEMSLTNADKPAMETSEACRRAQLFGTLSNDNEAKSEIPKDWGLILTSASLFIDKVRVLQKYLSPSGCDSSNRRKRKITFVIGTDTMVRIINPKYYGGYDGMLEAVREMSDNGVHFVVGGLLEQIKTEGGEEAKFVSGEEELKDLPGDVRDMFTIIQESDFRVDVSSTELRAKMAKVSTTSKK